MKNILYVGNALSQKGKNLTSVESLSLHLSEFCSVKIASDKSNKVLRLLDMIRLVYVNRKTADFVLIDTYSTTNFYYALVISQLSRRFKIKYIPILHGGNLEQRLKNNPRLSKMIFCNAYKLVSPSGFLKEVFENYGYSKIEHIPNTIELKNLNFFNRQIDTINLLWVRSFNKIYNPKQAVFVLKSLIEKGYSASLTMVGPETDGSLSEAKNLALSNDLDVVFTNKLPKKKWIELSKKSNVFINTTNFDNTPISVIEAMALGLPVVSTNVGGLPHLISDNEDGLLVSPNDIEAMVKAVIRLKSNINLKNSIVLNARKKAEHFDWKQVKLKWERLLS
jgi:glycosyltransferase involved in cell wall biosynthesis